MKYEAEINHQAIELEMEERDGRLLVTVGGRRYEAVVARPEEGVYLFLVGDAVYEARVGAAANELLEVTLRGQAFAARVIDRKQRRAGAEHGDDRQQQLTAPMPGKVVRLLLQAGDEVAAGQGVVVVEAMKMQNEIKSSKAGRLVEIRVNEGDTVTANQVLAVIE